MLRTYTRVWTAIAIAASAATASAQSSLGSRPFVPPSTPVPTYEQGFANGVATGQVEGFNTGYSTGVNDAVAICQTEPQSCGIYLGACLTAPQYGETEPNDNIVTADQLVLDTKFWGQSYGLDDRDWYYVVTTQPNQTLIINFSVPNGTLSGWDVSVRDAAGNVFARFDTGTLAPVEANGQEITYRTTLGLVGTYYIVLRPQTLSYAPYNLAAVLQDSPLETQNFVVGFFDAEIEPNDTFSQANVLSTGVSMFGVINLSFAPGTEVPDPDGDGFEYSQGIDEDWYLYSSPGNEILTLSVCDREECAAGNWFFEVFSATSAEAALSGYVPPLLAVNSDTGAPNEWVLGIKSPGDYFLRVSHKRLLAAPCRGYTVDIDNNGLPDDGGAACGCDSGSSCDISILNPGQPTTVTNPDGSVTQEFPLCPDGSGGGAAPQCTVGCICTAFGGTIEIPQNAITSQYNFTLYGTSLPPNTSETDAFQDFLGRPTPYAP